MKLAVLSIVLVAVAAPVLAADEDQAEYTARQVRAIRATSPITIDGNLNESVWKEGEATDWFRQSDPNEGAPGSQRTEVRIAYDEDAIYVGARLYDTAPDSILARLTRRDVSIPADRFSMYLDPFYDRRSGYYFMVNAAGTLYDGTLSNDGWEDGSWDGVWEGKAHVDKEGWTCEMRIPYSQMRFAKAQEYKWGINFRRVIPRNAEEDFLVYPPKRSSGFVSRFPALVGIENVSPVTAVELIPYLTSQAEMLANPTTADPFNNGTKIEPDAGGDLRMPVGSRLTLNATVNPDFGQVEVDPAVVNLSDVETFYPEKRPFFVENASVFSTGNQGANDYWGFNWPEPIFFYSRRVGRAPQGNVPDADYSDVPPGTTILGAAKLTGKLTPSMNFGTLHALTAREHADLSTGGNQWSSEVEPLTYYGVARGLKEFKGRKQGVGVLGTLTARSFGDKALRDEFNSASMLGVMDGWFFLDKNETWVISGWSAVTQVHGNETRMSDLQQDPRHYFQRPDANSVEVDPNATSMTGVGTRLWLNKQKGNTFGNFAAGFMSPKFELNDLGFESRADVINGHAGYGYKWTKPTKTRKYQDVLGAVFASYDFDGNPTWGGVWGGGSTEFPNNYSLTYRAAYNPQTVNPRRTRGGPLMLNMPGYETYLYFDTDSKSKLFYYVEAYTYTQPEAPSQDWNVYPGIEIKPVSNLTLNIGLGYDDTHESAQYLDTVVDATATTTYGSRYIFGDLEQKTWSASIRLNWAFSPTMSLQFYGQPLISTGDYKTVRELARPKSYEFLGAGAGTWTYDPVTQLYDRDGPGPEEPYNPDFNSKSLRGNAVFRWEYMPGSTLFLVWTQSRANEDVGDFNLRPSMSTLFTTDPSNIFMAKVTYYLNL